MPIAQGAVIMVCEFLSTPTAVFWLILSILLFALILALTAKKVWIDLPKRYVLKSELEGNKKQYEELKAKTRPRLPAHELFTCEVKREPIGKVRGLKAINGHHHLIFDMQVRNRTNYIFTTEMVYIACSSGSKLIFDARWTEEQRPQTEYIKPSETLQPLREGDIQFFLPIVKMDSSMRKFKLGGYVEYTVAEDEKIMHDIPLDHVKVKDIHLDYELDEEIVKEIDQKVQGDRVEGRND